MTFVLRLIGVACDQVALPIWVSLPEIWGSPPEIWVSLPEIWVSLPEIWVSLPEIFVSLLEIWGFLPEIWVSLTGSTPTFETKISLSQENKKGLSNTFTLNY